MINKIIEKKVDGIDKTDIEAIGLMGSYSRGEEKRFSDVDIVCILKGDVNKKSTFIEIIEGKYVVTSYVRLEEMERCFTEPESATEYILGLKQVKILYDTNGTFSNLKQRALNFKWTKELQLKANEIASRELVGWIEEVHKSIQGIISNDTGRMLNGIFGLTHGIFNVVRVQKGILLNGENTFYSKIIDYYGPNSRFAMLSEKAFGICPNSGIRERIVAGLLLFDLVTDDLMSVLRNEDKLPITLAKNEIRVELENMDYITK